MKRVLFALLTVVLSCTMLMAAPPKGKVGVISNETQFKTQVSEYANGLKGLKLKGKKPVVVDFFATWCGPCMRLSPIMDELAKDYKGKVEFYKVDVDQCKAIAKAYGINSIPFVIIATKKGYVIHQGFASKEAMKAKIDAAIK